LCSETSQRREPLKQYQGHPSRLFGAVLFFPFRSPFVPYYVTLFNFNSVFPHENANSTRELFIWLINLRRYCQSKVKPHCNDILEVAIIAATTSLYAAISKSSPGVSFSKHKLYSRKPQILPCLFFRAYSNLGPKPTLYAHPVVIKV
jgi:hypothetical protein